MKKDQNLPNKNIYKNNSSGKPLPDNYNASRQQSRYRYNYRGRSPDQKNLISRSKFLTNRLSRSNSQNNQYRKNYSRSNSSRSKYSNYNRNRSNSNPRNKNFQMIVLESPHTIEKETIQTKGIDNIKITDHQNIQILNQT